MVQDKGGRGSAFNTGFDSGRVVRKQMLGTFDSVRSVSSFGDIYSQSQSSSGGDDTGTLIEFRLFSIKSLNLVLHWFTIGVRGSRQGQQCWREMDAK